MNYSIEKCLLCFIQIRYSTKPEGLNTLNLLTFMEIVDNVLCINYTYCLK